MGLEQRIGSIGTFSELPDALSADAEEKPGNRLSFVSLTPGISGIKTRANDEYMCLLGEYEQELHGQRNTKSSLIKGENVIILYVGGVVVGYCSYFFEKGTSKMTIGEIYVSKGSRSKGYGSDILNKAVDVARKVDIVDEVRVVLPRNNPSVCSFFERNDFKTNGMNNSEGIKYSFFFNNRML